MLASGRSAPMRVLIDVTHPAYAHFFHAVLPTLRARGWEPVITSRDKDVTLALLDAFGIEHRCLSRAGTTPLGLFWEMVVRVWRLWRVIRETQPHAVLARDGVYACQAGWLAGVPAISFDDTDDAPIQQRLCFPFAWRIHTDSAYRSPIGPKQRTYKGVSCLAYLHPRVFQPDPEVIRRAGLDSEERMILVRLVSWTSNHDYGQRGLDRGRLSELLERLAEHGRVLLSSESPLEPEHERYRLKIPPQDLHHVMAHCALYVGESSSMAAECAVLGVPAVYVSTRRLWYTEELERDHGLLSTVTTVEECFAQSEEILGRPNARETSRSGRERYLEGVDDFDDLLPRALAEALEGAPEPVG